MHASPLAYRRQIETTLLAWGARTETAAASADVLLYAGLSGIDSHGISMLTEYDKSAEHRGWIDLKAKPLVVSETPVSALIDSTAASATGPACSA